MLGESYLPESERGFVQSSWRASLVVIVDAAILGTIQEVNYRRAADGVFQLDCSRTKTRHK